jgi:hypothetical protein
MCRCCSPERAVLRCSHGKRRFAGAVAVGEGVVGAEDGDECHHRSSAHPGSGRSARPHAEEAASEQGPAGEPHLVIVTDEPHIPGMEE